jgi:hypothetical protein
MDISDTAAIAKSSSAADTAILASIDEALIGAGSPGLHIIPSTAATLSAIPRWQASSPRVAVVAPSVPGTLSPTQLLALLRSDETQRPTAAIVFSDQLASPEHAPLLVEHAGITLYVSAVEAVAHVRYGLPARAWVREGFTAVMPAGDTPDVLRLLLCHYAACNALGSAWRMREAHSMRSVTARALQARRQLRLFHSAVMHTFRDSPLPEDYRAIASLIDGMQKRLATSMKA